MKHIAKKVLGGVFGNKLVVNILKCINKKKLIILYYHRVVNKNEAENIRTPGMYVDVDEFEAQMEFIKNFYHPISETDIIHSVNNRKKLPDYSIWITFDDGYRDIYTRAFPILKKYKIPATVFITTGFINKTIIPCKDYIAYAVRMRGMEEIKHSIDEKVEILPLGNKEEQNNTIKRLCGVLENKSRFEQEYLKKLIELFKVKIEDIPDIFLRWDEIKKMSQDGLSIGAHTVTHRRLSLLSSEEIEKEVLESKSEIEERLGKKVISFAYPKGEKSKVDSERSIPILKNSNFKLAVATNGGFNSINTTDDLLNLNRLGTSCDDTLKFFKVKMLMGAFWQV